MLTGWATGHFGLFHLHKESVKNPSLNLAGLGFAVLSLFIFYQARDLPEKEREGVPDTEVSGSANADPDIEIGTELTAIFKKTPSLLRDRKTPKASDKTPKAGDKTPKAGGKTPKAGDKTPTVGDPPVAPIRRATSRKVTIVTLRSTGFEPPVRWKWILGFGLAMFAGICFGLTFVPTMLIAQQRHTRSDQMDYVFCNFLGIMLTGNVFLVLYLLIRGEKSHTPRSTVLPAILSGAIWAVGQLAWFKANQELSLVIAVPIVSSLPGIVALTIGVFVFGELKTQRARRFAAVGVSIRAIGIGLIALSSVTG
jgi:hypothetical protein